MRASTAPALASLLLSGAVASAIPAAAPVGEIAARNGKIAPKVVILSLFPPEAEAWYGIKDFNVLAQNITVPGLSPLYPDIHCTANGDVCQVTLGESGTD